MSEEDKSICIDTQKKQTKLIREEKSIIPKESKKRAWETVNKTYGPGIKGGAVHKNQSYKAPLRQGGRPSSKGGK